MERTGGNPYNRCRVRRRSRARSVSGLTTQAGHTATGEGALSSDLIEAVFQIALALEANDLLGNLPVLKQQQGWDGANAILGGQALFVIDIDLADFDPPIVFVSQLIEDRRDHLAGAAPFGPKIDQNRRRRFQHFF